MSPVGYDIDEIDQDPFILLQYFKEAVTGYGKDLYVFSGRNIDRVSVAVTKEKCRGQRTGWLNILDLDHLPGNVHHFSLDGALKQDLHGTQFLACLGNEASPGITLYPVQVALQHLTDFIVTHALKKRTILQETFQIFVTHVHILV